jgi:hypothetical protein
MVLRRLHFVHRQMNAVREDRALGQRLQVKQALQGARVSATPRIVHVGCVLRDVDVRDGAELLRERRGGAERLVGDRERRVQPHGAPHEGRAA